MRAFIDCMRAYMIICAHSRIITLDMLLAMEGLTNARLQRDFVLMGARLLISSTKFDKTV